MKIVFKNIGIAKEDESPENPGGLERRVSLIPKDVEALVSLGCNVFVEKNAGTKLGFSDNEYERAGAKMQEKNELYANKDLIIKFKGPATSSIALMRPGSSLFCMAHVSSIPERLHACKQNDINLIAMEHVLEAPAVITDSFAVSYAAMEEYLQNNKIDVENIAFIGFSKKLLGAIQCACSLSESKVYVLGKNSKSTIEKLSRRRTLFVVCNQDLFAKLAIDLDNKSVVDLAMIMRGRKRHLLELYHRVHQRKNLGKRRIQCLHETGIAGTRYGLKLLQQKSQLKLSPAEATAVVIGYGNVAMGAVDELHRQGAKEVIVLNKSHTTRPMIEKHLERGHIVVNGADTAADPSSERYLVTDEHAEKIMPKGAVVVDLVGGSLTNRSSIEPVISCTFLSDPYFEKNGVLFTSLWGWPMMGLAKRSALKYSEQIRSVLIENEILVGGLESGTPGIRNAIIHKTSSV